MGLTLQHEVQRLNSQSDFTRRKSWSGLKALREEQTQGLVFLLKIQPARHKAHCQVWVSAWTGQDGRACSLVELFAGGVCMVEEQLAWGKLYSVGRLVLPEPVHYLLRTVQIHKAEGP